MSKDTMSHIQRIINDELAFLQDWKGSPGQTIYNDDLRDLMSGEQLPLWMIADRLGRMGKYHGIVSLFDIATGDVHSGWMRCHLSFLYLFDSIVARYTDFPRMRACQGSEWRLDWDITDFACCLLHAIVLSRVQERRIIARMLATAIDTGMCSRSFARSNPLLTFALWLDSILSGNEVPDELPTDEPCYKNRLYGRICGDYSTELTA